MLSGSSVVLAVLASVLALYAGLLMGWHSCWEEAGAPLAPALDCPLGYRPLALGEELDNTPAAVPPAAVLPDAVLPPAVLPPAVLPAAVAAAGECDLARPSEVFLHKRVGLVQDEIFGYVKHASQPTKGDIIMTHHAASKGALRGTEEDVMLGSNNGIYNCNEIYLTRTGSRESPSPKCGMLLFLSFIL